MNASVAVLLLAAFFVLFRLAFATFRQVNPPAWTKGSLVPELVCVGLVGLLAVSVTLLAKSAGELVSGGIGMSELALIVAALALAAGAWFFLPTPKAAASTVTSFPKGPRPTSTNSPGSPAAKPRRKAA
jgi:hypothetical protein